MPGTSTITAERKTPAHDIPFRPWHTLATDLFHWEGETYLLVADIISKFPLICLLISISSSDQSHDRHLWGTWHPGESTFRQWYAVCIRRIPDFAVSYGFQHMTSSPHSSRANRFMERMVQTVKSIFTKCKETRSDPHLTMLCYRTTPLDHNIISPSELLNHRGYKFNLPQTRNIHQIHSNGDNAALLQHWQGMQKIFHDRSTKVLPALAPQQAVRIQDPITKVCTPAHVELPVKNPRSYVVTTGSGSYRCNRHHIRPALEGDEDWPPLPPKKSLTRPSCKNTRMKKSHHHQGKASDQPLKWNLLRPKRLSDAQRELWKLQNDWIYNLVFWAW